MNRFAFTFYVSGAIFVLAHTWSPLFFSNQNQYLLHGYALAQQGELARDWLANTIDPTPIFSHGISLLLHLFGPASIQSVYAVVLFVYAINLFRIVDLFMGWAPNSASAWQCRALLIAVHASIVRILSVYWMGVDYPWYFQAGVAGQYLLGPGLQPSVFGVFLLVGIRLIVEQKYLLGCFSLVFANWLHSTYLLPSALLSFGLLLHLHFQGESRKLKQVFCLGLATAIPIVLQVATRFSPGSADSFQQAQTILAETRIPHHCVISRWLDWIAGLQVVWLFAGLWLIRRKAGMFLLVPAIIALLLSVFQWWTQNPTFALMFPWRISVVLLPIATAMLMAQLCQWKASKQLSIGLHAVAWIGGILTFHQAWGYRMNVTELPLLRWVKDDSKPNQLYLIPTKIPKTSGVRGSISATFTEPPRPKAGSHLIAVDLQRFRLATLQPIFVDFKSVPYSDREVLEWYRRVKKVEEWYALPEWNPTMQQELIAEGITRVVIPKDNVVKIGFGTWVYEDDAYKVLEVRAD